MFRNAFAAPGLLHIAHNMRASMHTVYLDWEVFWNPFENLEAALAKQCRRQRLIGTCIVDASAVGLDALAQMSKFSWTLSVHVGAVLLTCCGIFSRFWLSSTTLTVETQRSWRLRKAMALSLTPHG